MGFVQEVLHVLKEWWLGEEVAEVVKIMVSAVVMYVVALWIVRTGKKRFLGRNTIFDALLAFVLGSVLARAINGGAPILSTVLAGFALVGMHWLFGVLALRSRRFAATVNGDPDQLVKDGRYLRAVMDQHHITDRDVLVAARRHGIDDVEQIRSGYFEPNGSISIVPEHRYDVVTIDVQEGVQKVEISIKH